MTEIKILDCTLRDGGYINDWNFGKLGIAKVIDGLSNSGIEYIECGFLKQNIDYIKDRSLFNKISQLNDYISPNVKYTLMINYGECDIDLIPDCENKNICLRVAFKKNQMAEAIEYCKKLIEKGYDIFVNPMQTNTYTPQELTRLVISVNDIMPYCLTIVDTLGVMKEQDVSSVFCLINTILNSEIKLCLHFHNNLQMSFANAQTLISICNNRDIIIDSTLYGMGRGAGNLGTELITQFLNSYSNKQYNLSLILELIEWEILPVFRENSWGYSIPYYLSAINNCHPNYAKYLSEKSLLPLEMDSIFKLIPDDKKGFYDKVLIEQIYNSQGKEAVELK